MYHYFYDVWIKILLLLLPYFALPGCRRKTYGPRWQPHNQEWAEHGNHRALWRFPNDMKYAEISPVFKKKDDLIKANYRPVSILTAFIKVFETIIALCLPITSEYHCTTTYGNIFVMICDVLTGCHESVSMPHGVA